ncbi:MAG: 4-hydroxy-tetrahydrodipicolinate reductase [Clostridia bacterium]|nr:4-hydroxy-tetrahydrodipicolinate reductase [Clostridia bacterium]
MDILLCGCCGYMGRVVTACVASREDCRIAAGVDLRCDENLPFPVYADAEQCPVKADVVIDFSHPSALGSVIAYGLRTGTPLVIATTGLSEEQKSSLTAAAAQIPVFFSGNMSIGVCLLMQLAKIAAGVLGPDFDVEILERHHNRKLDAPSGTALMLADAVAAGRQQASQYVYERHSRRQKRDPAEIGISSMRGGTIVGEHEIMFAGRDEILTLSHSARSRELFAVGAVNAAVFLQGKPAGMYAMADLVDAALQKD